MMQPRRCYNSTRHPVSSISKVQGRFLEQPCFWSFLANTHRSWGRVPKFSIYTAANAISKHSEFWLSTSHYSANSPNDVFKTRKLKISSSSSSYELHSSKYSELHL